MFLRNHVFGLDRKRQRGALDTDTVLVPVAQETTACHHAVHAPEELGLQRVAEVGQAESQLGPAALRPVVAPFVGWVSAIGQNNIRFESEKFLIEKPIHVLLRLWSPPFPNRAQGVYNF